MTSPRRRVLRTPRELPANSSQSQATQRRAEVKLAQARAALQRWVPRLKRALNAVSKHQQQVARLEKRLAEFSRR